MINLLEGVTTELKIKSYMTLLENNLNFILWLWHSNYSTFKVTFKIHFNYLLLIINLFLIYLGLSV